MLPLEEPETKHTKTSDALRHRNDGRCRTDGDRRESYIETQGEDSAPDEKAGEVWAAMMSCRLTESAVCR